MSWTSDGCRNWKTSLRYDYDDFSVPTRPRGNPQPTPGNPQPTPESSESTSGNPQPTPDDMVDVSALKKMINDKYGVVRRELAQSPEVKGRQNDYIINIIYDR
jgi:hypothetical protein